MSHALAQPMTPPVAEKKGGAPLKNRNALHHGARSFIQGRWPKGASYIARKGVELTKQIEAWVMEQSGGSLPLYAEGVAQTAARHEIRALLFQKWLREQAPSLDIDQRIRLLEAIGKASDARDRCLEKLGLDRPLRMESDAWGQWDGRLLDSPPPSPTASPPASAAAPSTIVPTQPPDAPDASVGAQ